MAGVASQTSRVICRGHLGEFPGLCAVGFVTASADDRRIELWRLDGCGIVGVAGLRAVASFAGNDDMPPELFLIGYVGMAGLAYFMPGMGDGACCYL